MIITKVVQKIRERKNRKIIRQHLSQNNPTVKFKALIAARHMIDKKTYAKYVRWAIQSSTRGVPLEILLEALDGLSQKDLMSKYEIRKLNELPDELIIYRGTDACEFPPRISWSLLESIARRCERGQMYKAIIKKSDIIAYFCEGTDEEEIIAHVTDNFDDIF